MAACGRLTPISRTFGFDRGLPIDRYYIESFLGEICGIFEGERWRLPITLTRRKFGGGRVVQSDVLHAEAGNPTATIVADLSREEGLPPDAFDCIILTQTLQMIYDLRAASRLL